MKYKSKFMKILMANKNLLHCAMNTDRLNNRTRVYYAKNPRVAWNSSETLIANLDVAPQ